MNSGSDSGARSNPGSEAISLDDESLSKRKSGYS
jgi:hypothetical protein